MGHDYIWILIKKDGDKFKRVENGTNGYISFNWSMFSDIWHISDSHAYTGKTIAQQLDKAITIARKRLGIPLETTITYLSNVDAWGHKKCSNGRIVQANSDELLHTFICIMEKIRQEALDQPKFRLYSDQVYQNEKREYDQYIDDDIRIWDYEE